MRVFVEKMVKNKCRKNKFIKSIMFWLKPIGLKTKSRALARLY